LRWRGGEGTKEKGRGKGGVRRSCMLDSASPHRRRPLPVTGVTTPPPPLCVRLTRGRKENGLGFQGEPAGTGFVRAICGDGRPYNA
jgi:hypothetical protein